MPNIPCETELDNALVHQKDRILSLINTSIEFGEIRLLHDACIMLNFVEELWNACDYNYKVAEIRGRIKFAYAEYFFA